MVHEVIDCDSGVVYGKNGMGIAALILIIAIIAIVLWLLFSLGNRRRHVVVAPAGTVVNSPGVGAPAGSAVGAPAGVVGDSATSSILQVCRITTNYEVNLPGPSANNVKANNASIASSTSVIGAQSPSQTVTIEVDYKNLDTTSSQNLIFAIVPSGNNLQTSFWRSIPFTGNRNVFYNFVPSSTNAYYVAVIVEGGNQTSSTLTVTFPPGQTVRGIPLNSTTPIC